VLGFTGSREWVYPQSISGAFQTLRRWTFVGLHFVLFVVPWLTWAGHPLLRVDVPTRRTYLLGQIFTASDTLILALVLFFGAFSLFFFTSLLGRVWCGYACPQTVFLESWIRPIELWIEGDRGTRKRRDSKGLSFDLAWRKGAKWTLFLAAAFVLAMSFMSIFAGARELWTLTAGPVDYTFVAIFTGTWFIDFVWFREQFCNYLCPYARFQSALTDDESLLISYDTPRGEPRGGGTAAAADGRCIACTKCVVVCPQGIDIRDGFQMECIQCARCIDACTSVMSPLGHETLVRYSSFSEDRGQDVRRLRPRTVAYGGLLGGILAASLVMIFSHVPFEASVSRAPGSLYTVEPSGYIRNTYLLNIVDNGGSEVPVPYQVTLEGLDRAELISAPLSVAGEERRTLPLVVRMLQDDALQRTIPLRVRVSSPEGEVVLNTTFKTGVAVGGEDARW
jgi:cytochrome c oxidase accessory protein FixG